MLVYLHPLNSLMSNPCQFNWEMMMLNPPVNLMTFKMSTSQWRHNERDGVSNHRLFAQSFVQAQIKENIKAPRHWPFWGESTGDRWIPLTKGQWRGKCLHLMTSSCGVCSVNYIWLVTWRCSESAVVMTLTTLAGIIFQRIEVGQSYCLLINMIIEFHM